MHLLPSRRSNVMINSAVKIICVCFLLHFFTRNKW